MSGEGYLLDVYYSDASGSEHTFLLDVNCGNGTWTLIDARLGRTLVGAKHGPPGINVSPDEGAITGTAFWLDAEKANKVFFLREFLSRPYLPGKYKRGGQGGTGRFVSVPEFYLLSNLALRWEPG